MSNEQPEPLDLAAIKARYRNGIDIFEFDHLTSGDQENLVQADKDIAALLAELDRVKLIAAGVHITNQCLILEIERLRGERK